MSIEVFFESGKKVNARIDGFVVKTDQSVASGGEGSAPEPFTLFLASLATCAGIYVKSFCEHRQIPTDHITLEMDYEFNNEIKLFSVLRFKVLVPSDFPSKYDESLIKAVALCKVKRQLSDKIATEITIVRQ